MSSNNGNSAPWPVRKGIFRSTGQSDFVPTRTPSPIVEMPLSPMSIKATSPLHTRSLSIHESPLSPPPLTVTNPPRLIREIPIEKLDEVRDFLNLQLSTHSLCCKKNYSENF